MKESRRNNIRKNYSVLPSPLFLTVSLTPQAAAQLAKTKHAEISLPSSSSQSSSTSTCIFSARRLFWCRQNIFLIIPFFILLSATCFCTTTSSLSTLGLYKVGTGGVNLIDNILTHNNNNVGIVDVVEKGSSRTSNRGGSGCNCVKSIQSNTNTNKSKVAVKEGIRKEKKKNTRNHNHKILHHGNRKRKIGTSIDKKRHHHHNKNGKNNKRIEISKNKDKKTVRKNMKGGKIASTATITGLSEEDQKFLNRIQGSLRTVQAWEEDKELLTKCRSQIPWKDLLDDYDGIDNNNAGVIDTNSIGEDHVKDENNSSIRQQKKYSNYEVDRLLVGSGDSNALLLQRLCRWFPTFMSWVNAPPCKVCGNKDTEMKTVRGPETEEELDGGAKRVEVYYCPSCKANTTTFPRYNKSEKLLETRKGRCGEYSNLFGLFCRSAGFETRLVLDLSDHLWTEIRLGDSWIMADGCEGIIDKSSMYEHGWGKEGLCYMVAIGRDNVVDVTARYTRRFMTEDFQTRRREHTSSEVNSDRIFQKLNDFLRSTIPKSRVVELSSRQKLEEIELQLCKQSTTWSEQEKYGSGRISGSLAWKHSRQEAGTSDTAIIKEECNGSDDQNVTKSKTCEVAGFPVEAFIPPTMKNRKVRLQLHPKPSCRHDGIIVSNTPCAVGVTNSVSVVVIDDDQCLGCILQSKSFVEWSNLVEFVEKLPPGRIVLMNGKIEFSNKTKVGKDDNTYNGVEISRLGGWDGNEVAKKGVVFAGQMDREPDWSVCKTLEDDVIMNGYEVEIEMDHETRIPHNRRLRTERSSMPQRIAGRLPEAFMPLSVQIKAKENEKRKAYLKFAEAHAGRYCGYTTKKSSPIYLLNSTSYPLQKIEPVIADVLDEENIWNTFLELPDPLVPKDDNGIDDGPSDTISGLNYDVPLDLAFFNSSFGRSLLSSVNLKQDTADVLANTRLICLYFSAHWCGPCRQFTPMLAEMYDYLSDNYPTHGIEIVFVSGDRDEQSFNQYYHQMPWKAIPFDQLQFVKQALNATYGVRGIPSLVVLDAVSGQVVVGGNESRQEVVTACRGGELRIKAMFESWLGRTPAPTKELISMLELSARELELSTNEKHIDPDDNPYLKRIPNTSKHSPVLVSPSNVDVSKRIKIEFEKLVKAGHDPNSAAATALTIIANSTNERNTATIIPGQLDGKVTYFGKLRAAESKDRIDHVLSDVLALNSASAVQDVLTTALKYLRNSKNEPCEPKYRSFKLSNKIADAVTRVVGGLDLLQALGFEVVGTYQDFKASIPVAANMIVMEKKISRLIEDTRPK